MDPAPSVEAPDGVRLAPSLHRLRPLLGRVVLRESLQGAHELAVDEACRERVELIRDHRHPNLVEQGETFPHVAAQNEEPGFCDPSDGARRRVALEPISIARPAHSRALGRSPVSIRSYVRTTANHACADVSP